MQSTGEKLLYVMGSFVMTFILVRCSVRPEEEISSQYQVDGKG